MANEGGTTLGSIDNWKVILIKQGDTYGLNNKLTHKDEKPLVEILDLNHFADQGGQFVSRYYVRTFLKIVGGLNLDGRVSEWKMNEAQVAAVKALLNAAL